MPTATCAAPCLGTSADRPSTMGYSALAIASAGSNLRQRTLTARPSRARRTSAATRRPTASASGSPRAQSSPAPEEDFKKAPFREASSSPAPTRGTRTTASYKVHAGRRRTSMAWTTAPMPSLRSAASEAEARAWTSSRAAVETRAATLTLAPTSRSTTSAAFAYASKLHAAPAAPKTSLDSSPTRGNSRGAVQSTRSRRKASKSSVDEANVRRRAKRRMSIDATKPPTPSNLRCSCASHAFA
mmetsp:Transcript_14343/g.47932  ORF Transcript_14343/g.47932 Transcript_14343/m.47932 type:complete len:243 (+) Transcript_14343:2074-2802(+)